MQGKYLFLIASHYSSYTIILSFIKSWANAVVVVDVVVVDVVVIHIPDVVVVVSRAKPKTVGRKTSVTLIVFTYIIYKINNTKFY